MRSPVPGTQKAVVRRAIMPARITATPVTISTLKERLQLAKHEGNVTCTLAHGPPQPK